MFLKHDANMDVCYQVTSSDDFDLYAVPWNMGMNEAFQIDTDVIKIPRISLDKRWKVCKDSVRILKNGLSFREGTWENLTD